MLNRQMHTTSKPKPFYGWKLAVVVGLVYFCSGDAVLPTATIVNPLMLKDPAINMSGTALGAGFSLFVLMQGIPGPLIGHLIGTKGARFAMILGAIIMVFGALAMLFYVRTTLSYLICFGVVLSVGSIMAGLLSVQTTIGNWFIVRRGVAMTLMMCIAGVGAILVPFLVNGLVVLSGGTWQSGWYLVLGMALLLIPLAFFFVKNTPEELGQTPDGLPEGQVIEVAEKTQAVYKNTSGVRFKDAVRSVPFWLIALTGTGGFAAYTLAASQGVIHFTTQGFENELIIPAVMSMGFAGLFGRLIIGLRSDRHEPIRLMSISLGFVLCGILLAALVPHNFALFAYYLCTGFGFGAITTLLPTTVANYFGVEEFSKNLGATMLITTLVASGIPLLGGYIFDVTGSCSPAFLISAGIVAACAICGWMVRFPKRQNEAQETDKGYLRAREDSATGDRETPSTHKT
jgi:MFS family permease